MKLNYCQLPLGNFGDDLNVLIWGEIFGPVENVCDDIELWGIGTLLGKMGDKGIKKIVLGTGGGTRTPKLSSTNWDVRWVRGPLTACKLGLPSATGLGDASIMWSGLEKYRGPRKDGPVGIIPHWKTTLELWITPASSPFDCSTCRISSTSSAVSGSKYRRSDVS